MQTIKTIWVNGCFDILHRGHIELFRYAKSLGDQLVVGIDSDERVRSSKGPSRPFNNLDDRKYMLNSIKYIDTVVSFTSDMELERHIEYYSPDTMIVGSDWKGKPIIGSQHSKNVKYFRRIGSYSTTKILEAV